MSASLYRQFPRQSAQDPYKPEYFELLREHMAQGYSFEAFGSEVGIGKQTLYNGYMAHPEFKETKKIGTEAVRKKLRAC